MPSQKIENQNLLPASKRLLEAFDPEKYRSKRKKKQVGNETIYETLDDPGPHNLTKVPGKVTFHMIAHSHQDAGWLFTMEEYFDK